MKDRNPKFIIADGWLIYAYCTFHKDLSGNVKDVISGGWFKYDIDNSTINFYGSSDLYGKATLEQILSCIEKEQIGQRKGKSLLFKLEKIFYEDKEIWRK